MGSHGADGVAGAVGQLVGGRGGAELWVELLVCLHGVTGLMVVVAPGDRTDHSLQGHGASPALRAVTSTFLARRPGRERSDGACTGASLRQNGLTSCQTAGS